MSFELFFLFGLYMSLAIFRGEELSNCEVLTVFSSLWGSCHVDDGYALQEWKPTESVVMGNKTEGKGKT
jgi:hypothetical protein